MIQRIQSLYLLVSVIILSLLFVNPIAEIIISDELQLILSYNRIASPENSDFQSINIWQLTVLLIIISFLNIMSIFLYKNRILQMRLCILAIILLFGFIGMIWYFTKTTLHRLGGTESVYLWTIMIPFVSIILTYLAFKRIQKDEILVKSYDRIR